MLVRIKKLHPDAVIPAYQTPGSAGCDVCALEDTTGWKDGRLLVRTGISLEVPQGYECQVRPRSGLALKFGTTVLNSPGTIDSDYRGEVKVLLLCTAPWNPVIKKGDRIAQLVFAPVVQAQFEVADELNETDRGEGGFGSTGVR
jgi:dUTP pyrophosphatase